MDRINYLDAIVPTPFCVLGIRLRPFSLGMLNLLQRIESPLVMDDSHPTKEELVQAVLICSRSFGEGVELLSRPALMRSTLRSLNIGLRGVFRRRHINWDEALLMFYDYIRDGMRRPDVWESEGNIQPSAPWEEIIILSLMRCGYERSEVMDAYLPLVWFTFHTASEMDSYRSASSMSDVRRPFVDARDREVMDAIKAKGANGQQG